MAIVKDKETLKVNIDKSIFDVEKQTQIREHLKNVSGYSATDESIEEFESEIHNEEAVPFEGNVYSVIGNALSTKEIDKIYSQSVPSLWWLVTQSLVAYTRRLIH